eukprot:scaffold3742_cov74-Phaeocystis_antarctica.AAC.3
MLDTGTSMWMVAGGWADRDLQGAKEATTSLCMGSRKEGVTGGKKLAAKFDLNVYASPSIDMDP